MQEKKDSVDVVDESERKVERINLRQERKKPTY